MNKKQMCRAITTFWLMLSVTACGAVAPVTPTATTSANVTPTPTAVPGCEAQDVDLSKYGGDAFQNAEVIDSADGTLDTTLEVTYGDNQIAACPVHLRSYNGKLVGPTLRAKPGDKLKVLIKNALPPNPSMNDMNMNVPHGFNTTNFHTHGLHVSPSGISDNVLREMPPVGEDGYSESGYQVEVDIPANHPAGTFWYHAHIHGSTAVQVSSGMAGALIIEGGLDDVPEIAAAKEQTLLLQQIGYDTAGEIEDFDTSVNFQSWETLHRQFTINGQLYPTLTMQPGEMQRWRLIHGGVYETIDLVLRGPGPDGLTDLKEIAKLDLVKLNEVATDGLTTGMIDAWKHLELQPGYRSDVLVKVNGAGTYYLIDSLTAAIASSRSADEPERLLASIQVSGDTLDMPLPTEAELTPLKPFKDITDEEITGTQTAVFCVCKDENGNTVFTVNGKAFDQNNPPRELKLNAVEEWDVSVDPNSLAPAHPFHIHVNPFQLTRTGPDGKPEIVWKDTILVTQTQSFKLRTRYEDFTGKFVMHCHFLDHEDQGMMEVDEVVDSSP